MRVDLVIFRYPLESVHVKVFVKVLSDAVDLQPSQVKVISQKLMQVSWHSSVDQWEVGYELQTVKEHPC